MFFVADGHDSTSTSSSTTVIHYLSKNPDLEPRVLDDDIRLLVVVYDDKNIYDDPYEYNDKNRIGRGHQSLTVLY